MLDSHGIKGRLLYKIKYYLYASKFIEQELSSDLSEQAYFSFMFCSSREIMDKLKNTISYTIHFRYQPSLKANSTQTHQKVVMPHPYFMVVRGDTKYEDAFFNKMMYGDNIFFNEKGSSGKLTLFLEEIKIKKRKVINQVNIFNDNYKQLIHEIPGGQMKYFWNITVITCITSGLGFFIILRGIFKYIAGEDQDKKMKKID